MYPLGKEKGFTLVEIVIAIFILGVVIATILGTFTGIIASSREAEKKAELYQTGRALMDLIAMDVRGIFKHLAGHENALFTGESEEIGDKTMSKMAFISTNFLETGSKKGRFLSEVGYRVEKNPDENLCVLLRRSQSDCFLQCR